MKELDLLTVQAATVETKRPVVPVALDGEVMSLKQPMSYRIRPAALSVLVPEGTSACAPEGPRPSSNR